MRRLCLRFERFGTTIMNENKFRLAREPVLSVPVSDADKLLADADGNAALLYLYLLKTGGELDAEKAAADLGRTSPEVSQAAQRLKALGLLLDKTRRLMPAPELPEYSAQELSRRTVENPGFQAVVAETQQIYGRMLSGAELRSLFAVYDYLSIPAEVMFMLIHNSVYEFRQKHGEGRLPSIRQIEKEAYIWADRDILTIERAEEYIAKQKKRSSKLSKVKDALQIRGRDLSATELEFVGSWIDMGFDADALAVAYDKTVVRTGRLAWKYMDSIVRNWHSQGIHTVQEVNTSDTGGGFRQKEAAGQENGEKSPNELLRMKRLLERIKTD